jgi:hypothetical protein
MTQASAYRSHVARVVRDYLTQQNVDLLPWPAVAPDLSHIEHDWDEMERRLGHLPNQPVTLAEMGPALIRIWNNMIGYIILSNNAFFTKPSDQ